MTGRRGRIRLETLAMQFERMHVNYESYYVQIIEIVRIRYI